WDELIRGMSDDQIKWLPPEAALVYWLPDGMPPDMEHDVGVSLERYKVLGRAIWGSAVLSPAANYGGFDRVDAWGKLAEMNYVSGFIASIRTREFYKSGMLAPMEAVWPAAFYAAERMWTGKKTIAREMF